MITTTRRNFRKKNSRFILLTAKKFFWCSYTFRCLQDSRTCYEANRLYFQAISSGTKLIIEYHCGTMEKFAIFCYFRKRTVEKLLLFLQERLEKLSGISRKIGSHTFGTIIKFLCVYLTGLQKLVASHFKQKRDFFKVR